MRSRALAILLTLSPRSASQRLGLASAMVEWHGTPIWTPCLQPRWARQWIPTFAANFLLKPPPTLPILLPNPTTPPRPHS